MEIGPTSSSRSRCRAISRAVNGKALTRACYSAKPYAITKTIFSKLIWFAVAGLGAFAYVTLAFHRGERISSAYILIAALCSYAIGYRFYSKWVAAKVLALNDRRATPCLG